VKLLLDEMYSAALADALLEAGVDATTVTDQKLTGASDVEVFAAAVAGGFVVLTENVGDFTRMAAEHSTAGGHHPGLLIALSSRFSRRRAGIPSLVDAIRALEGQGLDDRTVYLERVSD
jgi:hypothetical protein